MVSEVPVISTDFYATILEMVGVNSKPGGNNGIDGMSIVPVLKGDRAGIEKLKEKPSSGIFLITAIMGTKPWRRYQARRLQID